MATDKKRFTISLEDELIDAVEQYQHLHQLRRRSDALLELATVGLNKINDKKDIKNYHDLDDHGKKIVDMVIKEEFDRMEREAAYKCCADILKLDYFDLPASAGFGLPLEGEYRTIIEVPKNDLTKKADFAIRVSGDSMKPDYSDGEIVLVKKIDVRRGDVGIFVLDGESYIKELGKDELVSHNKKYKSISLATTENIFVAGRVIGKL